MNEVLPFDRGALLRDRLELLTPEDLAALLSVDVQTLAVWRSQGRGPDYSKPSGKTVLYSRKAVEAYLEMKTVLTDRAA